MKLKIVPNDDSRLAFCEMLKEYRLARGLTMHELSEIVGVDKSYISKVESGRQRPPRDMLAYIVEALQIDTEDYHVLQALAGFIPEHLSVSQRRLLASYF